ILLKSKTIIGIGSPRASLESNFALRKLVGQENFYSGMSAQEHELAALIIDILAKGPARTPSLHDVETADAVLVLGEDVTNTAPMLALALRQAVRNKPKETATAMRIPTWDDSAVRNLIQDESGPLYLATAADTRLDDTATKAWHAAPNDIARLGFAIAHELNQNAPAVPGLSGDVRSFIYEAAKALQNARRPLIVSGASLGSEALILAAANVAWALCENGKQAELCYTFPECNSMGLGLMRGENVKDLLDGQREIDTIIILENDLYRRTDKNAIDNLLSRAKNSIVIDHLLNTTSSKADVILPAGTFAEAEGTLVNNEGRAQRFYQVLVPQGDIQESWKWIRDIMNSAAKSAKIWQSFNDISNDMIAAFPLFNPIKDIAPSADFRIRGEKIPRQPHRYSGRTAMLANVTLHEPKPPEDPDSPLSFSMEGYGGQPPAPLISRYWSPGWNSVQALNKFQQEVGGSLRGGDPGGRLIEPAPGGKPAYFTAMAAVAPGEKTLPQHRIFGSEELSMYSPAIAEMAGIRLSKENKP
ncbi:MAG TPA: molybdopterin-dependent oxidoreductase, partial [Nitrospirota bacterium]